MATIILFFSLMLARTSMLYLSPRLDVGFLALKQHVVHLDYWRAAFYTHVFSGVVVIFIGLPQFSKLVLAKLRPLHSFLGRAYVVLVLLLSGPSGLILACHANGGTLGKIGFSVLAILWMVFTFAACYHAVQGNIRQHQRYMLRSYSLTLTAISLRLLSYIYMTYPVIDSNLAYGLISWFSWMFNLLLAEALIYDSLRDRPRRMDGWQAPAATAGEGLRDARPASGARPKVVGTEAPQNKADAGGATAVSVVRGWRKIGGFAERRQLTEGRP